MKKLLLLLLCVNLYSADNIKVDFGLGMSLHNKADNDTSTDLHARIGYLFSNNFTIGIGEFDSFYKKNTKDMASGVKVIYTEFYFDKMFLGLGYGRGVEKERNEYFSLDLDGTKKAYLAEIAYMISPNIYSQIIYTKITDYDISTLGFSIGYSWY